MIKMRNWNVIKGTLKVIFYQLPIYILGFGVFPLIIVFYTVSGQGFNPTLIGIEVIDEDHTVLSEKFKQFLKQEPFEWVTERPSYEIIIPSGYEAAVLNQEEFTLDIKSGMEAKNRDALVKVTIENYHQQLWEALWIQKNVSEVLVIEQLQAINEANIFEIKDYSLEEKLAPFEQQLIYVSSFVFLLALTNYGINMYTAKKMEVATRIQLIPLTKVQSYHLQILESFIFNFLILLISWLTSSVFSSQILSSLINFIPIIGLITIMGISFVHLICEFLPEFMGKGVLVMWGLFELGYSVIELNFFSPQLERILPGMIVQHLYTGVLNHQWADFRFYSIMIFGFFILTYGLIRLKIWRQWGRQ